MIKRLITSNKQLFFSTVFLVAVHLAGVIGLNTPITASYFTTLVPFSLLTTFSLILFYQFKATNDNFATWILVVLGGYLIEVLGVHTGMIFGKYQYGETLGWKVAAVPVIIGFNWGILLLGAASFVSKIQSRLTRIVLVSLLMTTIDFLIEPVAIAFDFWSWSATVVPVLNYIGWFYSSALLYFLFDSLSPKYHNELAANTFIIQVCFFLMINLTRIFIGS